MNTRAIFITTTLLASLAFTGCSSSTSHTDAEATTDSVVGTDSVVTEGVSTTTTAVVTSTTAHSSGGGAGGTPTSAGATMPPLSTVPKITAVQKYPTTSTTVHHIFTTIPIVSVTGPRIVTLTAPTLTCVQAAFAKKVTISWTSAEAKSVYLTMGSRTSIGYPPNGSETIAFDCGQTVKVTATAIGSDGKEYASKTITISTAG